MFERIARMTICAMLLSTLLPLSTPLAPAQAQEDVTDFNPCGDTTAPDYSEASRDR